MLRVVKYCDKCIGMELKNYKQSQYFNNGWNYVCYNLSDIK